MELVINIEAQKRIFETKYGWEPTHALVNTFDLKETLEALNFPEAKATCAGLTLIPSIEIEPGKVEVFRSLHP